jgi:hypothetical protein
MPLTKDIYFLLLRFGWSCSSTGTLSRQGFVPRSSVNAENTSNVVPITRDGKFAVGVPPLVQKVTDSFADLVFAVLAMMAGTSDGIDWSCFPLILEEHLFKVFDGLLRMQAMEINI